MVGFQDFSELPGHRGLWSVLAAGERIQVELGWLPRPDQNGSSAALERLWWAATALREPGAVAAVRELERAVAGFGWSASTFGPETTGMLDALRSAVRSGTLHLQSEPHVPVDVTPALFDNEDEPEDIYEPPLPPETTPNTTRNFEVRFVDEVGEPIEGVKLRLSYLGEYHSLTTDGDGKATFEGDEVSFATVAVTDTKQLAKDLKPRWENPRDADIPQSTDEAPVHIEMLDDHFDPVRLEHDVPATVVIVPRFGCREIPSATFDFARSFIKRAALAKLSSVVQEMQQDDGQKCMIFGHTDTSGSDALNKRLSERRAAGIFALMTHDAALWESLWTGAFDKDWHWREKWGTRQMQHMLNTLHCFDDDNVELDEDGIYGSSTSEAVKRFQNGDYPDKPAEQEKITPATGFPNAKTREQLFLAYAKTVTRDPIPEDRISEVNGERFVGCGEFNPLSAAAKDRESRRVVLFVFDPPKEPTGLPCKRADESACPVQDNPPVAEEDGPPFHRCPHFKEISKNCHHVGGPDLAHDVITRFFFPLEDANAMSETFVLESQDEPDDDVEDADFEQKKALADDAQARIPPNEGPGTKMATANRTSRRRTPTSQTKTWTRPSTRPASCTSPTFRTRTATA